MSQLVAVSSPSSGREMIEQAARLRRAFFPKRFAERTVVLRTPPRIVDAVQAALDASYGPPEPVKTRNTIDPLELEAATLAADARIAPIAKIISVTADYFKVQKADIVGHSRAHPFVRPRHIVMYLAHEMCGRSNHSIARLLGKRDPTTIHHGVRAMAAKVAAGDAIVSDIAAIRARLG